jgi:hypothetical protein
MEKRNEVDQDIEFVIRLDTTSGSISISHPMDKLLAYGMLEFARKMIDDYQPQQQSIIKPESGLSVVPIRKLKEET